MAWNQAALLLAITTVVTWTAKALVIWEAGGLDRSDAEGPLFGIGFLLCLAAGLAIGVAATVGHPAWLRAIGGFAGVVVAVGVVLALDGLSGAVVPDGAGWVQEEAGLWAAALVALAAAVWIRRWRAPDSTA